MERTASLKQIMMENPLSSFYKLPLKDIAIRRMAVLLCSTPKVLRHVSYINLESKFKTDLLKEKAVTRLAEVTLSQLSLPEPIKEELLCLMKPLCREIAKWIHFHQNFCGNNKLHCVKILQHMCWTPVGTIDYRKTAEVLIRHEKLDIEDRYKLACLYCISDDIPVLWGKLPESCEVKKLWEKEKGKVSFYNDVSPRLVQQAKIVVYWTYVLNGQEDKLFSFHGSRVPRHFSLNQFVFESLAVQGYKEATEFFFQKLSCAERQISLVRTAQAVANERTFDCCIYRQEYQKYSDVLFYLFSLMNEEELLQVLKSHPCEILKCCLDWPRQEFFVDVAQLAFPYLKEDDYCRLLFILSRNITWGYNYSKVYRKFFQISPRNFIAYSLRQYGYFMQQLFHAGDVETVEFVFRNLDAKERATLVFSNSTSACFSYLIRRNKWDWLELFLRGAMLSQADKVKFASDFAAHNFMIDSVECKEILGKFEALVNSIIGSSSKCDKATQVNLPLTVDFPNTDLEENPAKKHKEV